MTESTSSKPDHAAPFAQTKPALKNATPRTRKPKMIAGCAAAVVILGAGTWFGSTLPDPTASDAYTSLAASKASIGDDPARSRAAYSELQTQHTTLENSIDGREANVTARESVVAASEKKIGEAEAAVKKREDAVTGTEVIKAKNTVGDGTWTVGRNIDPGTYLSTSDVGASCYWGIYTSGSNGSDIIENDIPGGGRPTVTLSTGQDFKSARCGTWSKQ